MRTIKFITFIILLTISIPTFTGCSSFGGGDTKPVPVAEGHDAAIVHAERLQRSSLDVYDLVAKWEYDNRAILPVEVSKAVDSYRAEFPKAWRESRAILKEYKANKGVGSNEIAQLSAVLRTVETALLRLRQNSNPNQTTQAVNAMNALSNFIHTIQALRAKQVASKVVVQ